MAARGSSREGRGRGREGKMQAPPRDRAPPFLLRTTPPALLDHHQLAQRLRTCGRLSGACKQRGARTTAAMIVPCCCSCGCPGWAREGERGRVAWKMPTASWAPPSPTRPPSDARFPCGAPCLRALHAPWLEDACSPPGMRSPVVGCRDPVGWCVDGLQVKTNRRWCYSRLSLACAWSAPLLALSSLLLPPSPSSLSRCSGRTASAHGRSTRE